MQVGVNYPWFDYGWDFGLGPRAWRGGRGTPRWYDHIDQDLRHFGDLGVSVVRWFILADGLTYGTDDGAPRLRGSSRGRWRFDPPPLTSESVAHFTDLLSRFAATGRASGRPIQLLPVFIDFHFCQPGIPILVPTVAGSSKMIPDRAWVKEGRAEAISNNAKRVRFLENALEPLLLASK